MPELVAIVGGGDATGLGQVRVDIFDAAEPTQPFVAGPDLPFPRLYAAAARTRLGLMVVGGINDDGGSPTQACHVLDHEAGTWEELPPLPSSPVTYTQAFCRATTLPDGRVAAYSETSRIDIFDPVSGGWVDVQQVPYARDISPDIASTADGRLFVAGGQKDFVGRLTRVDVLDLASMTWSVGPDMQIGRQYHTLTEAQGALWAIGGLRTGQQVTQVAERLDLETMTWGYQGVGTPDRYQHSVVHVVERLLISGGWASTRVTGGQSYDFSVTGGQRLLSYDGSGAYTFAPDLPLNRWAHAAGLVAPLVEPSPSPPLPSVPVPEVVHRLRTHFSRH